MLDVVAFSQINIPHVISIKLGVDGMAMVEKKTVGNILQNFGHIPSYPPLAQTNVDDMQSKLKLTF
jgi:hypothetical protein